MAVLCAVARGGTFSPNIIDGTFAKIGKYADDIEAALGERKPPPE